MILLISEFFTNNISSEVNRTKKKKPSIFLLDFQIYSFTYGNVSYKYRIICYLLSHINACASEFTQTKLLDPIAAIPNKAKTQILLPTIQAVTKTATCNQPADIYLASSEMLTIQLLCCFDAAAAAHLNNNLSAWNTFLLAIRTYLRSGGTVFSTFKLLFLSAYIFIFRDAAVNSTSTCACRSGWFVLFFKPTAENCSL